MPDPSCIMCVDGIDLRAWSSRSLDDNKRGFGDPDARLGRGGKGFYLGYRTVFLTDIEGFPRGHVEAPANVNEPLLVEPLLAHIWGLFYLKFEARPEF